MAECFKSYAEKRYFSVSAFTPVADYFLDDHSFAEHFEGDYSVPDYSVPDYSVVIVPW
jgi:hypothetical protein